MLLTVRRWFERERSAPAAVCTSPDRYDTHEGGNSSECSHPSRGVAHQDVLVVVIRLGVLDLQTGDEPPPHDEPSGSSADDTGRHHLSAPAGHGSIVDLPRRSWASGRRVVCGSRAVAPTGSGVRNPRLRALGDWANRFRQKLLERRWLLEVGVVAAVRDEVKGSIRTCCDVAQLRW